MAYLIFSASGVEIDRRALDDRSSFVIGRAPDCDIPVPDILLSRHHCRLERMDDGKWVVLDLGSKNGTYLGNKQISRHLLSDGDDLRLGPRTKVTFRAGPFEKSPLETPGLQRAAVRPVDPNEALMGTVSGFLLVEPDEVEHQPNAPRPRPRPIEPSSYRTEDVYGMLSEIASSSWDSIMAENRQPLKPERPSPRPLMCAPPQVVSKRRVAFCLQAEEQPEPTHLPDPAVKNHDTVVGMAAIAASHADASAEPPSPPSSSFLSEAVPEAAPTDEALGAMPDDAPATSESESSPAPAAPPRGWWRFARPMRPARTTLSRSARRQVLLALLSAAATIVLVGAWIAAVSLTPNLSAASASSASSPRRMPPAVAAEPVNVELQAQPAGAHLQETGLPDAQTLRALLPCLIINSLVI